MNQETESAVPSKRSDKKSPMNFRGFFVIQLNDSPAVQLLDYQSYISLSRT